MRDPRTDPIEGDVVVRGLTRRVTEVWTDPDTGSTVVVYGRANGERYSISLAGWRDCTAGATILKRGDEPRDVTQADRDALREAIWEVIKERTRYWVAREREIQDLVLGMSCDVQQAIDGAEAHGAHLD